MRTEDSPRKGAGRRQEAELQIGKMSQKGERRRAGVCGRFWKPPVNYCVEEELLLGARPSVFPLSLATPPKS